MEEEEHKDMNSHRHFKYIAKLETEKAIEELDELIEEAEMIMVPRGILGTRIAIEKILWI